MSESARYIRRFEEIGIDDVPLVGGKNASLGEMYRALTPLGVKVPNGFAITADAYRDMLTQASAWDRLHALLDGLDKQDAEGCYAHRQASFSQHPPRACRSRRGFDPLRRESRSCRKCASSAIGCTRGCRQPDRRAAS